MILKIHNILKKYPNFNLRVDDLEITENEVIGLVGNNGAGKTTLLSLILDLIPADSGSIEISGMNNIKNEKWKKITGAFLDENFLINFLSPKEYFSFVGSTYDLKRDEIENGISEYSKFLGTDILENNKFIREYSRGNKQKIGITGALFTKPDFVILDEPFNHLDPTSRIHLEKIIKNHNSNTKASLIVSSHDIAHITNIADKVILLENGEIKNIYTDMSIVKEELVNYFTPEE